MLRINKKDELVFFEPLLLWLLFTGFIVASGVVFFHQGFLKLLFLSDASMISWVISLLFLFILLHSAHSSIKISQFTNEAVDFWSSVHQTIAKKKDRNAEDIIISELDDRKISSYNDGILRTLVTHDARGSGIASNHQPEPHILEYHTEKAKSHLEIGWFCSDIMLKLGLLGTVVGFIMMLSSIHGIEDFDLSVVQNILSKMSYGMSTSLYTTLAGLSGSMLTAFYYFLLDASVERWKAYHCSSYLVFARKHFSS